MIFFSGSRECASTVHLRNQFHIVSLYLKPIDAEYLQNDPDSYHEIISSLDEYNAICVYRVKGTSLIEMVIMVGPIVSNAH